VTGIFNVAGDGKLGHRRDRRAPGQALRGVAGRRAASGTVAAEEAGLTQYGPEQIDFLRYRPVLDNRRLKEEFGYAPKLASAEVFELWRSSRASKHGDPRTGKGTVVLITGAAGGLGAALCRAMPLPARTSPRWISMRPDSRPWSTSNCAPSGTEALALPGDITDPSACKAAVRNPGAFRRARRPDQQRRHQRPQPAGRHRLRGDPPRHGGQFLRRRQPHPAPRWRRSSRGRASSSPSPAWPASHR
jgi:hypothetical protein